MRTCIVFNQVSTYEPKRLILIEDDVEIWITEKGFFSRRSRGKGRGLEKKRTLLGIRMRRACTQAQLAGKNSFIRERMRFIKMP